MLLFHKMTDMLNVLIVQGHDVLFLPPYSPDLNPIEKMWSKMKAYLRKIKARTEELLETAITEALNLISVADILGWYAKDAYSTQ